MNQSTLRVTETSYVISRVLSKNVCTLKTEQTYQGKIEDKKQI